VYSGLVIYPGNLPEASLKNDFPVKILFVCLFDLQKEIQYLILF